MMRNRIWLAALPALLLGVAACEEQSASNTNQPGAPSTAERPTTPPPAAGNTDTAPAGPTGGTTGTAPGGGSGTR